MVAQDYVPPVLSSVPEPGTDVMIFYIFSPNFSAKKLAFLTQNKANLYKMMIIT
jgi:hypothetical protein